MSDILLESSGRKRGFRGRLPATATSARGLAEAQIVYVRCIKTVQTRAALHQVKSMLEDFMASKSARAVRYEITGGEVTAYATHKKKPPLGIRFKVCKFLGYDIRVAYVVPTAKP